MDALETELVGVTFPIEDLKKIDEMLAKMNLKLPPLRQFNRQDFIRTAVHEKLKQLPFNFVEEKK
jgi:hypothetical protein